MNKAARKEEREGVSAPGPFVTGLNGLALASVPEEQENKWKRVSLHQGWHIPHLQQCSHVAISRLVYLFPPVALFQHVRLLPIILLLTRSLTSDMNSHLTRTLYIISIIYCIISIK